MYVDIADVDMFSFLCVADQIFSVYLSQQRYSPDTNPRLISHLLQNSGDLNQTANRNPCHSYFIDINSRYII